MKKKEFTAIAAILLCLVLVLPMLPEFEAKAYDDKSFEAKVEAGFGGNVKLGAYAPFKITVKNNDKDFAGYIQLIVPGFEGENNMYQTLVNIPSGESSVITFSCPVENNLGCVNVRLADKKGKVIWEQQKLTNVLRNGNIINVGVFSDDFAALGYMDKAHLFSDSSKSTSLFELDLNTLTSDWHSIEMLDVIVISDFSTDLFTDKQKSALSLWVENGGMLLVGTGSTSSKTLSGLNNDLFTTNNGTLRSYSTRLGIGTIDYSALFNQNNFNNKNTYYYWEDDKEYVQWIEDNFEDYREDFGDMFGQDFYYYYGYDDEYDVYTGTIPENSDIWDSGDQEYIDGMIEESEIYVNQYYKDYVSEGFYQIWLNTFKENDIDSQLEVVNNASYITADTLAIDLQSRDMVIEGEIQGGGTFDLIQIKKEGDGYICLAAVDFTKNPIPSYQGASVFFIGIVDKVAGRDICNRASEYENAIRAGNAMSVSYGYYARDVVEANSSAPLPPIAIYLLIIWGYVVSIIVLYVVIKKKNKVFNLWFIYPSVAVGVGLLIFCIGFSSRIIRPVINTSAVITMGNGKVSEDQYATVITPSRKEYNVGFSGDYTTTKISKKGDSYSYRNNTVDITQYSYAHTVKPEGIETTYKLNPLEGSGVLLSKIELSDKDVTFKDGLLTNDTGVTLENCILVKGVDLNTTNYTGIRLYDVDKLVPGATFDVSTHSKYEMQSKYYTLSDASEDIPSWDTVTPIVGGALIGSRSAQYVKYKNRKILLSLVEESVELGSGDYLFIGFPKEKMTDDTLTGKKYHENKHEVVVRVYKSGEY